MRKELNIKGFINELSYNLTMQELEDLVVDYQSVVLDFIINSQYNYKMKKEFQEVCELIRSDKYFKTIAMLINSEDERIKFDMAYVLYTATHFSCVDSEMKAEALRLGYKLREVEMTESNLLTKSKETNIAITIASIKTVKSYEVTSFFRSKEVENIMENFPEVLYNAYNKIKISEVNEKVISFILLKAIPELQPDEIITALGKAEMNANMDKLFRPYTSRIQAFLFKLCGGMSEEKFNNALYATCKSINKFNERTGSNETLMNKYLNYRLLEAVVNSKDVEVPQMMKVTYKRMKDFKNKYQKFSHLF